ncbi:hypothetical protein ACBJ59_50470 [Nonomuraea sp. MTCD27]
MSGSAGGTWSAHILASPALAAVPQAGLEPRDGSADRGPGGAELSGCPC